MRIDPAKTWTDLLRVLRRQAWARWLLAGMVRLGLVLLLFSGMALAQKQKRMGPPPRINRPPRQAPKIQGRQDQHQHPPGFFQHLRELPPAEQERIMTNDARFQNLPPERQAQIRDNLRKWNSLTPQQKEATRERQDILQSFSPEQREEARSLFPQYNHLPPDRKQAVMAAFTRLRDMPPGQREELLSSAQAQERFSPEELNLLRGLSGLLPK